MGGCLSQTRKCRHQVRDCANHAVDLFGVADQGTRRGRGGHLEGLVQRAKTVRPFNLHAATMEYDFILPV